MTTVDRARGRSRPFWADLRFLVGVALVVLSVLGVWAAIAAARHSEPVLVLTRTLVPGERVGGGDVRVVDAVLGDVGGAYPSDPAQVEGRVSTRVLESGELLPAAALTGPESVETTTVVVRTASEVPQGIGTGSVVDLWDGGREGEPESRARVLIPAAVVARVGGGEGVLGAAGSLLELVVPVDEVPRALEAIAADARLAVVSAVAR